MQILGSFAYGFVVGWLTKQRIEPFVWSGLVMLPVALAPALAESGLAGILAIGGLSGALCCWLVDIGISAQGR